MAKKDAPPRWDRKMQQRLARGEAAALGELYDRFASLVHGLAHTVLGDERAADLGVTEEEARRRLRLGLQLLSTAHDAGSGPGAPPEYGGAA
jgi:hypothetical protein